MGAWSVLARFYERDHVEIKRPFRIAHWYPSGRGVKELYYRETHHVRKNSGSQRYTDTREPTSNHLLRVSPLTKRLTSYLPHCIARTTSQVFLSNEEYRRLARLPSRSSNPSAAVRLVNGHTLWRTKFTGFLVFFRLLREEGCRRHHLRRQFSKL
jgi:hypothetical protein